MVGRSFDLVDEAVVLDDGRLVGSFEEQLDKKVLLAFFVPAVVYMADAVGTQTETVLSWGDADVALAVGLALAASCSIATTVATILPRLLARFGMDPAYGSGPPATIVQDLLSITVYLVIATPIAT